MQNGIVGGCIDEVERRPVGGVGAAGTVRCGLADAESFFGAEFGADQIVVVTMGRDEFAFELKAGVGDGVGGTVADGSGRGQADADWVCIAYVWASGVAIAW